jgi:SAM-dependent methyltransferase
VHHAVPGIVSLVVGAFVALGATSGSPWQLVAAVLVGAGTSLVLGGFALILHLQDVYSPASRRHRDPDDSGAPCGASARGRTGATAVAGLRRVAATCRGAWAMPESEYLLRNDATETAARFGGLEECFDPVTIQHLSRVVRPGARCLEVGAGSGSIARWMGGVVGPSGRVLATDLDPRWFPVPHEGNVEVRRHDIVDEPVPEGPWDVIHERLVLVHLPARLHVLDRLIASLAPGGWLVVEDFDTAEVRTTDRGGPDHELIVRVAVAFNDLLRERGAVTSFAADARRHLADRGMVDVDSSGHVWFGAGGTGFASVLAANTVQVRAGLERLGITGDDLDRYLAVLADPTTVIGSSVLISTSGRRPD